MIILNCEEASKEFERYWDDLKTEWFKVEVLQDYTGEDNGPSLQAFIAGDKEKSIELIKEEAKNNSWVKSAQDKKFKRIRIHIVEEPYSQYLLWEIENYKLVNIPLVGERVFLVKKNAVEDLKIPDGDFMIFDDRRVVRSYYTPDEKMYKADFYNENDDISNFLSLKQKLTQACFLDLS